VCLGRVECLPEVQPRDLQRAYAPCKALVDEYLAEGGPLWMLEHGLTIASAAEGATPVEYAGRPMFPGRLHVVALVIESTTDLLASVERFARSTATEVRGWATTTDLAATHPDLIKQAEAILLREVAPNPTFPLPIPNIPQSQN
jgi:hypothetical protein